MTKLANKEHEIGQLNRIVKLEKRVDADDRRVEKLEKRVATLEQELAKLKSKS